MPDRDTLRIVCRNPKLDAFMPNSTSYASKSPPSPVHHSSLVDQLTVLALIDPSSVEAVRLWVESRLANLGHETRSTPEPIPGWQGRR